MTRKILLMFNKIKMIGIVQSKVNKTERLTFIDGMRGLVSLGIALYHFAGHRIFSELPNEFLTPLFSLLRHQGKVSAFFVISGFALGYSVGRRKITGRYLISFLKRRLIRLSIPYWFTIGFVLITTWLAAYFIKDYDNRMPALGSIITHVLYVYPLFRYQPILEVFWTLVHTVQFILSLFCSFL
jgi:peptidoglycan/LPS O-acetylase OafA/YrhL